MIERTGAQAAYVTLAVAALVAAVGVRAGEYEQAVDAIADEADARRDDGAAAAAGVPEPTQPTPEQRERMLRIVDQAAAIQRDAHADEIAENPDVGRIKRQATTNGPRYRLFVSRSMGWDTLTSLFQRVGDQPDVQVLFRGIPEGSKIDTAIREVGRYTRDISPLPSIRIDPPAFVKADVQTVPTITVSRDGELVARATGTSSIQGMKRRLEQGRAGDLGQLGPVFAISEPNLIKVMKARASQIDTEALKQRARQSYWDDARFQRLTVARKARERRVDPTITVKRDIKTPGGRVIARAGDQLNPLEMRPFGMRVVVFDATDARQLRAAEDLADGPGRVIYLATAFDADRGWNHYREVTERLDRPVYKLTRGLRRRFELQRVPAVVTADGGEFVVREVPAERYRGTSTTATEEQ